MPPFYQAPHLFRSWMNKNAVIFGLKYRNWVTLFDQISSFTLKWIPFKHVAVSLIIPGRWKLSNKFFFLPLVLVLSEFRFNRFMFIDYETLLLLMVFSIYFKEFIIKTMLRTQAFVIKNNMMDDNNDVLSRHRQFYKYNMVVAVVL